MCPYVARYDKRIIKHASASPAKAAHLRGERRLVELLGDAARDDRDKAEWERTLIEVVVGGSTRRVTRRRRRVRVPTRRAGAAPMAPYDTL